MDSRWSKYYKIDSKVIGDINQTIYQALREKCLEYSDRRALVYGEYKISFEKLLTNIDSYAEFFHEKGITAGDKVGICHNGIPATVFSIYALNKIGAVVVPIYSFSSRNILKRTIEDNKIDYLMVSDSEIDALNKETLGESVRAIFFSRITEHLSLGSRMIYGKLFSFKSEAYKKLAEIVPIYHYREASHKERLSPTFDDYDACAFIMARNPVSETMEYIEHNSKGLNNGANNMGFLLNHDGDKGTNVMNLIDKAFIFSLQFGMHTVLLSGNAMMLHPEGLRDLPKNEIVNYSPEILIGYPAMVDKLMYINPIRHDSLKNLKKIITGGATVTSINYYRLKTFLREVCDNPEIIRVYGTQEIASAAIYNPEALENDRIIGIPFPDCRVRILNSADMSDVSIGEKGEIALYSNSSMLKHTNKELEDRLVFRAPDGRNYIRTGDIGHIDENGYIYYDGSSERTAFVGDVKVYPRLIEDEIRTIIGVSDAAIVVIGSDIIKTSLVAAVVPDEEILFDNYKLIKLQNDIKLQLDLVFPPQLSLMDIEFRVYLPRKGNGMVDYSLLEEESLKRMEDLMRTKILLEENDNSR